MNFLRPRRFALLLPIGLLFSLLRPQQVHGQDFLKGLLTKEPGPLAQPHAEFDNLQGCASCHQNRLGGDLDNKKCLDCHTDIKERLDSQRGYHWNKPNCSKCHADHKGLTFSIFAPKDWIKAFNHDETGYELLGKHTSVPCADCHKETRTHFKTKLPTTSLSYLNAPTTCYDCHKKEYEHKFSKQKWLDCSSCHSSAIIAWKRMTTKPTFKHDETAYPLEGLHTSVPCTDCHKPSGKEKRLKRFAPLAAESCTDCHRDPHKGEFGNDCTTCHSVYRKWKDVDTEAMTGKPPTPGSKKSEKSSRPPKGFDHSKTRFPLLGFHQAASCSSCHTTKGTFKMPDAAFATCSACHGSPHKDQFANQTCESCHTLDRHFNQSTFDIDRHQKTKFPLSGKHLVLDCNRCHFNGQFEKIPSEKCSDCHRNPHDQRQIDKECSFCHVTTTFSWIQFDHNKNTEFKLTGRHRDVACLSCHVDQVFKDMPADNDNPNCQTCHATPHGPSMPDRCQDCHRTEGFRLVSKFDHKKIGQWSLEGRHAELSCQKCHAEHLLGRYKIESRSSSSKPNECANCHVDVHQGKMGSNCASCHNFQTFALDQGEQVHDLGFFKLSGTHDQLPCSSCHRPDTNLQGQALFCTTCHQKNDIHLGKMGPNCNDCHGQNAWLPTTFKHNQTAFKLTGAHRYLPCADCHKNQIYQGLPNDCYFCHSDSKISGVASHQSGIVQDCADCHSTLSWTMRRGAGFP